MSGKEIPDSDPGAHSGEGMGFRVRMFLREQAGLGNQSLPRTRFRRNIAGLGLAGAEDSLDEVFGDGWGDLGLGAAALLA